MILFDSRSASMTSPTFLVRPGKGVVLSAFGLAHSDAGTAQLAIIEKVRYEDGIMPHGDVCEDLEPPEATILQNEDVTQCGLWGLSPCQNLGVLTLPGSYRLTLNDAAAIGSVYVEAIEIGADAAALVPQNLFFGAAACDCGG
ncbi:hypothetical protein P3T23_004534 [Paraburkholderia sp. GAS448]|uniref:hypothetical protein n=1 Tax=Paraburkholderia sp. GAS448 TaxID=3035136 RepID=UPI003D1E75D0